MFELQESRVTDKNSYCERCEEFFTNIPSGEYHVLVLKAIPFDYKFVSTNFWNFL